MHSVYEVPTKQGMHRDREKNFVKLNESCSLTFVEFLSRENLKLSNREPERRQENSQEPPGVARGRQGQPGATRSSQKPGAQPARNRQEPPAAARNSQDVPGAARSSQKVQFAQFMELSYVLADGAAGAIKL